MSTTSRNFRRQVLVRAFRGEPAVLWLGHLTADRAYVWGANPNNGLDLPKEDIFAYDAALAGRLAAAFGRGDQAALEAAWSDAEPVA